MNTRGVIHIWEQIIKVTNNRLRDIGIGSKNLPDFDKAMSLLIRRTFQIKTMREVDYIHEDVNKFIDNLLAAIEEGRKFDAEVLQNDRSS